MEAWLNVANKVGRRFIIVYVRVALSPRIKNKVAGMHTCGRHIPIIDSLPGGIYGLKTAFSGVTVPSL